MVLLTENEANKLLAPFVSPVQEVRRTDSFLIYSGCEFLGSSGSVQFEFREI